MKQGTHEAGWHIGFAARYAAETLAWAGYSVTEAPAAPGDWSLLARRPNARHALRVAGSKRLGALGYSVETHLDPVAVELSVRPELVGEWVDKVLGITVDTEVGDPGFDRQFVVGCAPSEAAPTLLSATVRQGLRTLAGCVATPTLTLRRDGWLRLEWEGSCGPTSLGAALEVVGEVASAAEGLFEGVAEGTVHGPFRAGSGGHRAIDPQVRERDRLRLAAGTRRFVTLVTTAAVVAGGVVAGVIAGV